MPPDEQSRRRFLRRLAATTVAASLAGCGSDNDDATTTGGRTTSAVPTRYSVATRSDARSPTASPTDSPTDSPSPTATPRPKIVREYGDRFDTIVDLKAAGADATGERPVNDHIGRAADDDTLLYFPSGTYKLEHMDLEGFRNLGFVSLPDDDTTIVPANPDEQMGNRFMEFEKVRQFLFAGFDFDYRQPGYGGVVRVIAHGDLTARNLRIRGKMPDYGAESVHVAFRFDVRREQGRGLVERVVATDGGHDSGNSVGIYVGKDHAGTLEFRDCEIANFPNNGLYASAPGREVDGFTGNDGPVHVRGGRYENNNIANIRLGSSGSTVKDARIAVTRVPPSNDPSTLNARGLRLRGQQGQVVENCDIHIGKDAGEGFGAIVFHPDNGHAIIRDTTITVDRDGTRAVRAFPPADDNATGPTFENVTIRGQAATGDTVHLENRDGTTIRNCAIEQSGDERHGLSFADSSDCLVADSTIRVTGTPIVTNDSTVERKNVTIEQWTPTSTGDGDESGTDTQRTTVPEGR